MKERPINGKKKKKIETVLEIVCKIMDFAVFRLEVGSGEWEMNGFYKELKRNYCARDNDNAEVAVPLS